MERRALRAIQEYRLVKDGITDYCALGYALDDKRVIAPKLIEHLVIEQAYAKANETKYRNK